MRERSSSRRYRVRDRTRPEPLLQLADGSLHRHLSLKKPADRAGKVLLIDGLNEVTRRGPRASSPQRTSTASCWRT